MINVPYWESEKKLAAQLSQWERKRDIFVEQTKHLDGNKRLQALVLLLVTLSLGHCNVLHLDAQHSMYALLKLED